MTVLQPLPDARFGEFAEAAAQAYAHDNVASGRWVAHEAESLARDELYRLLPQGIATPDHSFFEIQSAPGGAVVGFVWLAALPRGARTVTFVFQIVVHPEHRRQGHARAALRQVEALAVQRGHAALVLNVFSSNAGAQALYRSLGYRVTSLSMDKPLASSHVA